MCAFDENLLNDVKAEVFECMVRLVKVCGDMSAGVFVYVAKMEI